MIMSKLFSKEELESFEKEQEFVNELIVKYQKKVDEIDDLVNTVPFRRYVHFKKIYEALVKLNNEYEDMLEL